MKGNRSVPNELWNSCWAGCWGWREVLRRNISSFSKLCLHFQPPKVLFFFSYHCRHVCKRIACWQREDFQTWKCSRFQRHIWIELVLIQKDILTESVGSGMSGMSGISSMSIMGSMRSLSSFTNETSASLGRFSSIFFFGAKRHFGRVWRTALQWRIVWLCQQNVLSWQQRDFKTGKYQSRRNFQPRKDDNFIRERRWR